MKFDIVKNRKKYFLFSGCILLLGLLFLLVKGLHLGVDFKAGTRLDLSIGKAFSVDDVADVIRKEAPGFAFKPVVTFGDKGEQATTTFDQVVPAHVLQKIEVALQEKYGDQVTRQESTVDPAMAKELAYKTFVALLIASGLIVLYVALRFQLLFGVACVAGILHDIFIPVALFSVFRLEVDLTFIAAILTITGYSINDKIVIFDRIRENIRTTKVKTFQDLEQMVNRSLWQTMRRSVYTVLTVFFTAVAIAVLGGEGIRNFSIALVIGLVSGTYSSIFIAAQLWVELKKRELAKKRIAIDAN